VRYPYRIEKLGTVKKSKHTKKFESYLQR